MCFSRPPGFVIHRCNESVQKCSQRKLDKSHPPFCRYRLITSAWNDLPWFGLLVTIPVGHLALYYAYKQAKDNLLIRFS